MKKSENEVNKFSAIIIAALHDTIFNKDSEYYVNDQLCKNSDMTDFVHAMSNTVPALIYAELTGDKKDILQFNHMANTLVVQYHEKE